MDSQNTDIYLTQLISGILLFKRKITCEELSMIMSTLFNKYCIDVLDTENRYDTIYNYIESDKDGFFVSNNYNNSSLVYEYDENLYFRDYLIRNTTPFIINFLCKDIYDVKNNSFINFEINSKRKHLLEQLKNVREYFKNNFNNKKKIKKMKHGIV